MDYPVVFRCSECTLEHETLDLLECHIWSRHLQTFPYYCALCNYPTLSAKTLCSHYAESHPKKIVEFKRKINADIQLREMIAHSIVVPFYEDEGTDSEVLYAEENSQGMSVGMEEDEGPSYDTVGARETHIGHIQQQERIVEMENGMAQEEVTTHERLEGEREEDERRIMEELEEMSEDVETEVVHQPGTYIVDEEGNVYEGEEGDEEVEYVQDEQGNIFLATTFPHKRGRDLHMRLLKEEHMDLVVRKVAHDGPPLRKTVLHECDVCGKILKYPSKMEEHRRTHSGVRPFKCPQCSYSFTQRSALKVHMRSHTGERPYECTWECGKTFPSSSALRMHERCHSGERNYACSICGQLFQKKSHMVRHEKTRHLCEMRVEEGGEVLDPMSQEKAAVDEVVSRVQVERQRRVAKKNLLKPILASLVLPP